jgi:hypothetical protein
MELATIVITGICMFVRPKADEPPRSALFMEARKDRQGSPVPEPHHVFLAIDADKYHVTNTAPPEDQPDNWTSPHGGNFTVFVLDDKSIDVAVQSAGPVDDHDLTVTTMKQAWPRIPYGGHSCAKELRDDEMERPAKLRNRVNARLRLRSGTLHTMETSSAIWRIEPKVMLRSQFEGKISQEVEWEVRPKNAGRLDLTVYDYDNTSSHFDITISPIVSGDEIRVLLANVPDTDLFPANSCINVDCAASPHDICCMDHHFVYYYNAFDNPPSDPPLPHRVANPSAHPVNVAVAPDGSAVHLFRVEGSNCGPTQWP